MRNHEIGLGELPQPRRVALLAAARLAGLAARLREPRRFFFNPSSKAASSCSCCPASTGAEVGHQGLELRDPAVLRANSSCILGWTTIPVSESFVASGPSTISPPGSVSTNLWQIGTHHCLGVTQLAQNPICRFLRFVSRSRAGSARAPVYQTPAVPGFLAQTISGSPHLIFSSRCGAIPGDSASAVSATKRLGHPLFRGSLVGPSSFTGWNVSTERRGRIASSRGCSFSSSIASNEVAELALRGLRTSRPVRGLVVLEAVGPDDREAPLRRSDA